MNDCSQGYPVDENEQLLVDIQRAQDVAKDRLCDARNAIADVQHKLHKLQSRLTQRGTGC